jgi:hypothetical protein
VQASQISRNELPVTHPLFKGPYPKTLIVSTRKSAENEYVHGRIVLFNEREAYVGRKRKNPEPNVDWNVNKEGNFNFLYRTETPEGYYCFDYWNVTAMNKSTRKSNLPMFDFQQANPRRTGTLCYDFLKQSLLSEKKYVVFPMKKLL